MNTVLQISGIIVIRIDTFRWSAPSKCDINLLDINSSTEKIPLQQNKTRRRLKTFPKYEQKTLLTLIGIISLAQKIDEISEDHYASKSDYTAMVLCKYEEKFSAWPDAHFNRLRLAYKHRLNFVELIIEITHSCCKQ